MCTSHNYNPARTWVFLATEDFTIDHTECLNEDCGSWSSPQSMYQYNTRLTPHTCSYTNTSWTCEDDLFALYCNVTHTHTHTHTHTWNTNSEWWSLATIVASASCLCIHATTVKHFQIRSIHNYNNCVRLVWWMLQWKYMCKNLYSIDTVYNLVLNSTQLIWTPCTDTHTQALHLNSAQSSQISGNLWFQTIVHWHTQVQYKQNFVKSKSIMMAVGLSKERMYVPCAFVSSSRASDHTVSIHSYYKCMECYTKYQQLHCFTKYAFYNYWMASTYRTEHCRNLQSRFMSSETCGHLISHYNCNLCCEKHLPAEKQREGW